MCLGVKRAKWEMGTNTLDEFLIGLRNYYSTRFWGKLLKIHLVMQIRGKFIPTSLAADSFDPVMNNDKGNILLRVDPNFAADGALKAQA